MVTWYPGCQDVSQSDSLGIARTHIEKKEGLQQQIEINQQNVGFWTGCSGIVAILDGAIPGLCEGL